LFTFALYIRYLQADFDMLPLTLALCPRTRVGFLGFFRKGDTEMATGPTSNTFGRELARFVAAALFLVLAFSGSSSSQERKAPQTAGVENNKMGPYRALAQLAYTASQKGDNATAATLAKILERTWDKAEDYGGDTALSKTNHALFENVDKAMDSFINILLDHQTSAPDPAKVKTLYLNYLEKLKLAE
jgi:hypothetical protein